MATTSWGIPLTDGTEQVAPLQGLFNRIANALDTALSNVQSTITSSLGAGANARTGTTTARASALAAAANGSLWQDTNGIKMLWKKDGSAWVPAVTRWAGTNTQRDAFTEAPNGFEWFSTTSNKAFIKISGTWTDVSPRSKAIESGTVGGTSIGPNAMITTDIAFPAGAFTSPPRVVPTIVGDFRDITAAVSDVTKDGFKLRRGNVGDVTRTGVAATWIAVEK